MDKLDNINDICNNFKNFKIQNKKKSYIISLFII